MLAESSGLVTRCDAGGIGRAAFVLGAGRVRADQAVHPGVGLILNKKPGETVTAGEPLAVLRHVEQGLDDALVHVRGAYVIEP